MATKKKKSPPRRPAKAKPRRRAVKAAPAAAVRPLETAQPSSNNLLFALLFLGLAGLSWLGMRSCSPKLPVPVATPAPLAAVAQAPASPVPAPAARSVAPAAAQKSEAPKARPSARRETAGAETGEPSLTFDRAHKKTFEMNCWRSAASPAQLDVFAPHNRLVRSLKSEAGAAGWVKLQWDGKNTAGKKVAEGLYFLRPSQEGEQNIHDLWVKD